MSTDARMLRDSSSTTNLVYPFFTYLPTIPTQIPQKRFENPTVKPAAKTRNPGKVFTHKKISSKPNKRLLSSNIIISENVYPE